MTADRKDNDHANSGDFKLPVRTAGKFIFWATIALLSWLFLTVLANNIAIAVLEQKILNCAQKK